jgi:hypothetical protein
MTSVPSVSSSATTCVKKVLHDNPSMVTTNPKNEEIKFMRSDLCLLGFQYQSSKFEIQKSKRLTKCLMRLETSENRRLKSGLMTIQIRMI